MRRGLYFAKEKSISNHIIYPRCIALAMELVPLLVCLENLFMGKYLTVTLADEFSRSFGVETEFNEIFLSASGICLITRVT